MKRIAVFLCLSAFGAMLLTGCSSNFTPSDVIADEDSPQGSFGGIQGTVHGGNFPVTGAQVYLFATGTGGYNTASKSLITSGAPGVSCNNGATWNGTTYSAFSNACYVYTDTSGSFDLANDYSCTSGQQVYMVALGGNPGLGGETPVTTTATTTNNGKTMTVTSATGIVVGETVTGTGIANNTTVSAVSGTTVTLSKNANATGSTSVTFDTTTATPNGTYTITVASATGITTGMAINGTGVGGIVTAVNGKTITLSQQTSLTGSNAVVFSDSRE